MKNDDTTNKSISPIISLSAIESMKRAYTSQETKKMSLQLQDCIDRIKRLESTVLSQEKLIDDLYSKIYDLENPGERLEEFYE